MVLESPLLHALFVLAKTNLDLRFCGKHLHFGASVSVPLPLVSVFQGHKDSIEALVADGLFVLSGSCDGEVRVWNVSSLELEGALNFLAY